MRKVIYALFLLVYLLLPSLLIAQETLSLQECRNLALKNSKAILISQEKIKAAQYNQKAASTAFLPSVSASGAYIRNQKELSLLSDNAKDGIQNLGPIAQSKFYEMSEVLGKDNPVIKDALQQLGNNASTQLGAIGESILDAVRTDTRNIYFGQVTLVQPLYMGGKIRAYNKITKFAENIAKELNSLESQDVILSIDQTYWMVISLVNKQRMAESYLKLLNNLESDVQHLIDEGVATKADGLAIKVKVNEAEMILTKVNDGLALSRMLLCQLCGLEITTPITLTDEKIENFPTTPTDTHFNLEAVYQNRPEIKSLMYGTKIFNEKININRAAYLPEVALIGNYMVTNPAMFNGFENRFRGNWNIGVAVKVPLLNWGKNIYKTRAAKVEAKISEYELLEAKEKVELQVNQSAFKMNEAAKKLAMTEKNMERAQENLDYATYGFEEGVIPANTVLEAHTNWLSAQSDKIDAQLDVKLTLVYFQKATGTLIY